MDFPIEVSPSGVDMSLLFRELGMMYVKDEKANQLVKIFLYQKLFSLRRR